MGKTETVQVRKTTRLAAYRNNYDFQAKHLYFLYLEIKKISDEDEDTTPKEILELNVTLNKFFLDTFNSTSDFAVTSQLQFFDIQGVAVKDKYKDKINTKDITIQIHDNATFVNRRRT